MISAGLPGRAAPDTSPVFQFYSGLALGMVLGRLFEEHFSNLGGTKVCSLVSSVTGVDFFRSIYFVNLGGTKVCSLVSSVTMRRLL